MTGYLDTSVVVAYYCPETLSDVVGRFLRRVDAPVISPLVEVELYSAISLKVRTRNLDITEANRVIALFRLHLSQSLYRTVSLGVREFTFARDWLARFSTRLRTLDALHLAAAFSNDLPLITTDRGMADSAKQLGVKQRLISHRAARRK